MAHTETPANRNYATMTNAEKIQAAAIMFGTGSRQHLAATRKYR